MTSNKKKWYVVHTYSGYENKVKMNLEQRVKSMGIENQIFQVLIPTEKVLEVKSGKRKYVQKKVFPGYVVLEMILDNNSWQVVRNTPGVTRFVGSGGKPVPLKEREIDNILKQMGKGEKVPKLDIKVDENIRIIVGPFTGYTGKVKEIDHEKSKLKAFLSIFGRETSVELGFNDIEKY
ncbi:transcription termination/antitermination protein NusG [Candidatus Atribacteria bacterium MT.SAG.1]|nr:transcription termination/antitermination protein NusG [Candidatus Atribacteria bacterium MT.SAG.1]